MAIDKYESQIQHSLYGRKLGLDNAGFVVGNPGQRIPTEIATTADVTTPLTGYGASALTGSTAAYVLAAPAAVGLEKIVVNASTLSTAVMSLVRSTANGACAFAGSTANGAATGVKITLQANGAGVRLVSFSTGVWTPVASLVTSSAQTMTITTSS
jgi:hypothetical protein